ncbi:MAG: methyltransferase domain-containing protein [Actinomycetota bacterium]|nr:methyltransferase domain-containing protein [Actinomycetota bacterium]MDZ4178727.1 methyltransferase domain-containing protein [Coriobacteriia bacterium]
MSSEPFWEDAYREAPSDPFGSASSEVVEMLSVLPVGSRVLDLGCGMGRNSVPLARAGMSVTCVDMSEAACARIRSDASELVESGHLSVIAGDMGRFDSDGGYDLIIAHGVLHLLERDERLALVERMKRWTIPCGFNILAVFTDRLPTPADMLDQFVGLFDEGEIAAAYSDWDIVLSQAYTLDDEHAGGIRHSHPVNKVVARRRSLPANPGVNPTTPCELHSGPEWA